MPTKDNRTMTTQYGRATVQGETLNEETREVDVVFATETPVTRFGWEENFNEVLVCDADAVRMDRADKGLPVIDCHQTHSVFNQIGRTVKIWINESRELCARLKFSQRDAVTDLFKDITDGIVTGISVGYNIFKFERIEQDDGKDPIYRAIDWQPIEISFAPVQADINSAVRNQQSHAVEIINSQKPNNKIMPTTKRTTTKGKTVQYTVADEAVKQGDIVTVDGVSGVALSDGEVGDEITLSIIEPATPAPTGGEGGEGRENDDDPPAGGNDNDDDDKGKGARSRSSEITSMTRAAGLPADFALALINEKKSVDQCRQAVIDELVKNNPNVNGTHGVIVGLDKSNGKREAIANALMHRITPGHTKLIDGAREYRGMSLTEVGKELLSDSGASVRGMSRTDVATRVFSRAHSTGDFPLLMEGVVDKLLRQQYGYAPEFWSMIAKQTSVSDFRAKGLYGVGAGNGMKKVAEGAEVKYHTLTESKATIRVETFAEGISFTRQAFVNDDLSAFAIIPSSFVRDWDIQRGDLVWGLLTDNVKMGDDKTLFHVDHKNMITGANSPLTEASLGLAKVLLSKQTDITGKTIRIAPKFLIVPPELEITARKLIADITATKTEDVNVFAKAFIVIVEPRLKNPKAWYLAADPNAVDALYYAYLDGNEALRVDSEDDFSTDTMKYAVRGDFGAAAIDHRGLAKSNGE